MLKDFNIKEVAGLSNGPAVQNYTVNVTENFLEVHFFSANKGTCCIPSIQTHGPLISAIRVTPRKQNFSTLLDFITFAIEIITFSNLFFFSDSLILETLSHIH